MYMMMMLHTTKPKKRDQIKYSDSIPEPNETDAVSHGRWSRYNTLTERGYFEYYYHYYYKMNIY